jgi:hypothetical protein
VGDIAGAYKHVLFDSLSRGSILSVGGEITFPTGRESVGLGGGVTLFEAFGTFSKTIGVDGFLHLHAGIEVPSDEAKASKETFWRAAFGKSFLQHRYGRAWTPMVELLAAREMVPGARPEWDVVPQMQVSLSDRQHVLLNVGASLPVNVRSERGPRVLVYLLWDWFDGSLFDGW